MKADGIIHPKEEDFMNQIYRKFGITIDNIEEISGIDDLQAKLIINSMSEENKAHARFLCISLAEADGFVHLKELEIINQIFV